MAGYPDTSVPPGPLIYILFIYMYGRVIAVGKHFDLEKLRLPPRTLRHTRTSKPRRTSGEGAPALPRHRRGEHFLKGPIPFRWLARAACCPGRALHVGILIWFRAFLTKTQPVTIPKHTREAFGLDRKALNRGIDALASAGLVRVERATGNSPRITVLDPETQASDK